MDSGSQIIQVHDRKVSALILRSLARFAKTDIKRRLQYSQYIDIKGQKKGHTIKSLDSIIRFRYIEIHPDSIHNFLFLFFHKQSKLLRVSGMNISFIDLPFIFKK